MSRWFAVVGAVVAALSLWAVGCAANGDETGAPVTNEPVDVTGSDGATRATVVWTDHGIPHVTAGNYGDLGFGQGWAAAHDRACDLAVQLLRVDAGLSRWFGPGDGAANVASDFGYAALDYRSRAADLINSMGHDAKAMLDGYAEGFNTWLADPWVAWSSNTQDTPGPVAGDGREADEPAGDNSGQPAAPATTPDPSANQWCLDEPWVRPLDSLDLLAHHHDLATVEGTRRYIAAIAAAQPPGPDTTIDPAAVTLPEPAPVWGTAWGLGRSATQTDESYLAVALGGPWDGQLAWWENHLTIPGTVDAYGFSLVGVPGVVTGFNRDVAWAQVPSAGVTHTVAALDLVDGDPTSWRWDSGQASMEPTEVSIEVLTDDGAVVAVKRTLWSTVHGPVIDVPGMGWDVQRAYALVDPTVVRPLLVDQFVAINESTTLAELEQGLTAADTSGPLATVAVGATGWVLFADPSATPSVSDDALLSAWIRTTLDPVAAELLGSGTLLVDGGDPTAVWGTFGSTEPGSAPPGGLPRVQVRDWVVTSGQTNEVLSDTVLLDGWSPLQVPTGRPLAPVDRRSLLTVAELVDTAGTAGTAPLSVDTVADALFDNRGLIGSLVVDEVVERCTGVTSVAVPARPAADGSLAWPAQTVDVGEVCRLLGRWSGEWNLNDQAPAVWSQFLAAFAPSDLRGEGLLFAGGSDPENPVGTPFGLAPPPVTGPDPVLVALAEAALAVEAAGIAVDEAWVDVHGVVRGGERIGLHGDTRFDGNINSMIWLPPEPPMAAPGPLPRLVDARTGLRRGGRLVNAGTNAAMVVGLSPRGVSGLALLPPGQSADPTSPFHVDQAYRFSDQAWRPMWFDDQDINNAALFQKELQSIPQRGSDSGVAIPRGSTDTKAEP